MANLSKASNVVQEKYILYDVTGFTQKWHSIPVSWNCHRRRTLKSTLHPTIFWEMVKLVDLGVLYFSLVLPV